LGEKRALAESLRAGGAMLGLLAQDPVAWFAKGGGGDDAEIDSLVQQRDALRRERKFKEADRIRDELALRGIVIEDVAGGARWRRTR
jgi:cysteinyl-tRNA synthetase